MVAVEALFRYQSKDIKDSILQNYSTDNQHVPLNNLDNHMVFQDEEL